jgi:hypothetical protein
MIENQKHVKTQQTRNKNCLPFTGKVNGSLVKSGQSTTETCTSAKLSFNPFCITNKDIKMII